MRLLPRKHILQYDWLAHLYAVIALLFPVAFFLSDSEANPWQLALLIPLFMLQWYHGFWQSEKHVAGHYLIMMFLASWAMSMHWLGAAYFFYGQVFLLKVSRFLWASIALNLQAIWIVVLAWWWQFPPIFSVAFYLLSVLGGHANYLFFTHLNTQRQMLMTQEELEYVSRERERERIARDLHDILGHTLSVIALKADLADKLITAKRADKAQSELSDIAEAARTALADVRQTMTGYRSGNLRSEVLSAKRSLEAADIEASLPDNLPKRISREVENVLSLIIREAVTNVIRHSRASLCTINLFNKARCWHLIVEDNGIGWKGEHGNGLTGMSERVSVMGGKLMIKSESSGTRLHATVDQVLDGNLNEDN